MKRVLVVLLLTMSACSPPPPRDAAFFEENPAEAERVSKACAAGQRTNECLNAQAGLEHQKAKARMERYRKGFE